MMTLQQRRCDNTSCPVEVFREQPTPAAPRDIQCPYCRWVGTPIELVVTYAL